MTFVVLNILLNEESVKHFLSPEIMGF